MSRRATPPPPPGSRLDVILAIGKAHFQTVGAPYPPEATAYDPAMADAFYARLLTHNQHALWLSPRSLPDLGGSEADAPLGGSLDVAGGGFRTGCAARRVGLPFSRREGGYSGRRA